MKRSPCGNWHHRMPQSNSNRPCVGGKLIQSLQPVSHSNTNMEKTIPSATNMNENRSKGAK